MPPGWLEPLGRSPVADTRMMLLPFAEQLGLSRYWPPLMSVPFLMVGQTDEALPVSTGRFPVPWQDVQSRDDQSGWTLA